MTVRAADGPDDASVGGAALRAARVRDALAWARRYGVLPRTTSAVSEHDAARLAGLSEAASAASMAGATAVRRGDDVVFDGRRYQVKANRPSGKPGNGVTLVGTPTHDGWDVLSWILCDRWFRIEEAWSWVVGPYTPALDPKTGLRPDDDRKGRRLDPGGSRFGE